MPVFEQFVNHTLYAALLVCDRYDSRRSRYCYAHRVQVRNIRNPFEITSSHPYSKLCKQNV